MRWLIVVVTLVGCGKGSQQAASGGSGAAAAGSAKPAVVVAATDAAAPPADASVLGDLPALTLALPADRGDVDAAEKLNNEGYGFHVKKDWANAFAKYSDALKKDPGNLLARYNLASAYHSSGDDVKALALLAQFKTPNCRPCDGILIHSRTDSEWKGLQDTPEFKAITDGPTADKVDLKKIAAKISTALKTKKLDEIAIYIHPHNAVKERDSEMGPTEQKWKSVYGVDEFQEFANKLAKDYMDNGVNEDRPCDKQHGLTCCAGGMRGDTGYTMGSACFSMIGGIPFIAEIEFDSGL